ncbi:Glutamate receptor-interacting protein 1 [Nymphon striatum]|nr:Glutamate receptor-interacting protein 1 [Nymphon striatum]
MHNVMNERVAGSNEIQTWLNPVQINLDRLFKFSDKEGSKNFGFNDYNLTDSHVSEEKRGASIVELLKKDGSTLGIIFAGGSDKGTRPRITNLRAGSIAHRSDALCIGDYIVAVNGIRTRSLKHEEIVNLLKNAEEEVILEVEYEIPDKLTESIMCVCPKAVQIRLQKENGSFGFTVRGGVCDEKLKTRPLIITNVRPGGSADREGTIKPGDRLLAADNYNLTESSHSDALAILKQLQGDSIFTIEYDVSIMDAVKNASGPLLVEIEKSPGSQLGIALTYSSDTNDSPIVIESIKQASIAERSGALHVGDQILAVDGTRVDQMTAAEVSQLLKLSLSEVINIEIIPISQMALKRVPETVVRKGTRTPPGTSLPNYAYPNASSNGNSGYNTLSSMTGLAAKFSRNKRNRSLQRKNSLTGSDLYTTTNSNSGGSGMGVYHQVSATDSNSGGSGMGAYGQVCHTEMTEVILTAEHNSVGFSLKQSSFAADMMSFPIIAAIDPGGPAEKSGVIQVGDRLLSVNGQRTNQLTVEEVTQLLKDSKPQVTLDTEFDVAESVVPSSGTFCVKLPKNGGLGITITSPKNRKCGDALLISDIKNGSVAHRTGTIQPGDQLLGIDTVRMDNCTIEDAAHILQSSENIVQLRIRKDDAFSEDPESSKWVVYTMELVRHGGPLGITISGTEESFDPVIISGLTPNGLAEKTGALHVGDRLLAINGKSLRGKVLSEAIQMLQNSGDIVTLKICKDFTKTIDLEKTEHAEPEHETFKMSTPLPSVDSAVESWGSSGMYDANMSAPGSRAPSTRPSSGNQVRRRVNDGNQPGVREEDETDDIRTQHQFQLEKDEAETENGIKRGSDIFQLSDEAALTSWRRDKWKTEVKQKTTNSSLSESDKEDWSKVLEDLETCGQSLILRQLEKSILTSDDDNISLSTTSAFETVKRNPYADLKKEPEACVNLRFNKWRAQQIEKNKSKNSSDRFSTLPHSATRLVRSSDSPCGSDQMYPGTQVPVPSAVEIHKVTLFKDSVYEDFGFSLSDGLYQRGVFVNRIRPGGPADLCGLLRPFDRLLQVNGTKTEDFDCCLTVPLIATSGDQIELVFSRNPEPVSANSFRQVSPTECFNNSKWMGELYPLRCSSPSPPPQSTTSATTTL